MTDADYRLFYKVRALIGLPLKEEWYNETQYKNLLRDLSRVRR